MTASNNKCRVCDVCGTQLRSLYLQSPVVTDNLWHQLLDFYGFSEERAWPKAPAQKPVFMCVNCMEKALGRKLSLSDVENLPFNLYFRLNYFYMVPVPTVIKIIKYMSQWIARPSKYTSLKLQREVDFMNGVLMPFIAPECAFNVPSSQSLAQFSDDDLKQELKRRENELRSRSPENVRCRDCKHCGEGYCSTTPRWGKTTVCLKRPKPTAGNDRYCATNQSRKACEMFEPK